METGLQNQKKIYIIRKQMRPHRSFSYVDISFLFLTDSYINIICIQ